MRTQMRPGFKEPAVYHVPYRMGYPLDIICNDEDSTYPTVVVAEYTYEPLSTLETELLAWTRSSTSVQMSVGIKDEDAQKGSSWAL